MNAKQIQSFKHWLNERGADIMEPTNNFEVVRFACSFGVGVVYRNKKGVNSYSNDATRETVECWKENKKWAYQGDRIKSKNKAKTKPQLIARDGNECFYCGEYFDDDDLTVEHVLSRTHGGVDKLVNMVLACADCNEAAGTLSVVEKVSLRDRIRGFAL